MRGDWLILMNCSVMCLDERNIAVAVPSRYPPPPQCPNFNRKAADMMTLCQMSVLVGSSVLLHMYAAEAMTTASSRLLGKSTCKH